MSAGALHLVHLETSGNQAFIFGTNKLKENVGASEMTYRAGTEAVARAVNHVFGLSGEDRMPEEAARPDGLAAWLLRQPAIEASARPVEVLLATSGKALLLVRGEVRARELVHAWSTHLAVRLPGVDGLGVVSEPFALGSGETDGSAVAAAVSETHRRFEVARALRPSPEARFSRLPLAATCEVSGLPAEVLLGREGGPPEQLSHVSAVKRAHLDGARERFAEIFGESSRYRLPSSLDEMLDLWSFDWLGVVHADGNGLGQLFLRFESIARALAGEAPSLDRAYVDLYREFSVELDRIAREVFAEVAYEAFGEARKVLPERDRPVHLLPVLPIIVGGDDLTVVCDGHRALPFVRLYLATLEKRLAGLDRTQVLTRVLQEHFGVPRFGMAAGVALVKPKFPFFSAYALAGQLTESAKAVKQHVRSAGEAHPASALDFHVTFESSMLDLPSARERLVATRGKASYRLHGRPYV
ncbi:MAG TPA: hypothetical protein VLF66_04035, partial [Thermoanaerobaculia bacterium]|nr:hypothetical protein [Thermoanaerobaculia bacterium]